MKCLTELLPEPIIACSDFIDFLKRTSDIFVPDNDLKAEDPKTVELFMEQIPESGGSTMVCFDLLMTASTAKNYCCDLMAFCRARNVCLIGVESPDLFRTVWPPVDNQLHNKAILHFKPQAKA